MCCNLTIALSAASITIIVDGTTQESVTWIWCKRYTTLIVTNFDTKWTERIIKSCILLYHFFCLSPFFWKILQLFFNRFESFLTFLITLACIIQRLLNLARVLHIRHSLGDLDLNFTLFFIYSHKCFSGNKFKILHTVKGFIKGFY